MAQYKAIIFDLFNTITLWDSAQMPTLQVDGIRKYTTLGALEKVLRTEVPEMRFGDFSAALTITNLELAQQRKESMQEVSSQERFRRTLILAGHQDPTTVVENAESLSKAHMGVLKIASSVPPDHKQTLELLKKKYKIGLLSNFDHGPTAKAILSRDGVIDCFDSVVVSDDHGLRKPHPKIFLDAVDSLGVSTQECLFVGDSTEDDLVGANRAGIDVAWVNPKLATLPNDIPAPRFTVNDITEIPAILKKVE